MTLKNKVLENQVSAEGGYYKRSALEIDGLSQENKIIYRSCI